MRKAARILLLVVVGCSAAIAGDAPPPNTPEAATQLFSALSGRWSCSGAFADGRPLASEMTFTAQADGRSLLYHHEDRPPNNFLQDALWGPDTANRAIVSLAFAGNAKTLVPQLFVSTSWTSTSVVFEAKALTSPPFAPNRFTYKLEDSTLRMIWEVQRQGSWSVGDQLKCNR